MNDKLSIGIGADITELKNKIKEAEFNLKELSKVKLDKIKLGLDTKEIDGNIKSVKQELLSLRTIVKDVGGQIGGNFTKQVGKGSNTLMQFSRIAQDAPYGIIGIGNNITATAESFGYLKAQTGSTSGALKAMASSLMGTGGILLGVSLLTTGFTLLAQSGLSVGDIIDKVTGNFNEFGGAIKKAGEEGLKSAAKEVESLRSLIAIAQNDNIAKKDRLIAVENLQKQFPAYYGNLTAEKIMYGDLTKETNLATKALISRAVAEKLGDKAADKFIERLNAQKKFNDAKKDLDDFDKKSEKDLANLKNVSASQIAIIQAKQLNARNKLLNKAEEERQSVIKLVKEYDAFGQVIDKLNVTAAPLSQTDPKATKAPKKTKVNPNAGNEFTPFLQEFTGALVPEIALTFKDPTDGFLEFNSKVSLGLTTLEQLLLDFNQNASQIINGALIDTFAGIGTAIGTALATGGNVLNALGSTLLSSLGGVLTEMGKMAIQVGVGLLGIKAALKTLNPAVAIAAGVGLIALGSFFSSKSASIANSGGGKSSGTSTSTGSGANNSSTTSGSTGGWSGGGNGTVVFEIAGTSLIGVLNNTTERNLRLGGR